MQNRAASSIVIVAVPSGIAPHSSGVSKAERARHRSDDFQRFVDGELFFAVETVPERFPLDQRHDVVQESVCRP